VVSFQVENICTFKDATLTRMVYLSTNKYLAL